MTVSERESESFRETSINRFAINTALIATALALLPTLVGFIGHPPRSLYYGQQYSFDDHMVYAAWMHQAMNGALLFDNRFAIADQPSLTLHVYFLLGGWVAKLIGIPLAATLGRALFSGLFVWLLGRLFIRLRMEIFVSKLAVVLVTFGGGLGFALWTRFGHDAPIDVWQPEAFVFPSMLTNGLFMVSACLIVYTLDCAIHAREGWGPVLPGAIAFGLLMNIHSYDVVIVGAALLALLATSLSSGMFSFAWLARVLVILAGALPAALWLWNVYSSDPVFRERAATPTFTQEFGLTLLAIGPAMLIALVGAVSRSLPKWRRAAGIACIVAIVAIQVAAGPSDGFAISWPLWGLAFALAIASAALLATMDRAQNLFWAWAATQLTLPYLPVMFQRKLAMMQIVPWVVLAAFGLAAVLERLDRNARNMTAAVAIALLSATSVFWLRREIFFVRQNVSSTTTHAVYIPHDALTIIERFNELDERVVVLAMPGVPLLAVDANGEPTPNQYVSPLITDLNPVFAGLAGAYVYAGHWSETPDYLRKRSEATEFFLAKTEDSERRELIERAGITHIVAPNPDTYTNLPLADLTDLGRVELEGNQLLLIAVE